MTLLLLLAACDKGPWTTDAALTPTLARMDRDKDGAVTEPEYAAVAFNAPAFAEIDADHDGKLGLDELGALIHRQDPTTFFFSSPDAPPPRLGGGKPDKDRTKKLAILRLFESLQAEVVAADPAVPVPTEAEMDAAAETATLDTPENQAMLARLEAASKAAGCAFPRSLTHAPEKP